MYLLRFCTKSKYQEKNIIIILLQFYFTYLKRKLDQIRRIDWYKNNPLRVIQVVSPKLKQIFCGARDAHYLCLCVRVKYFIPYISYFDISVFPVLFLYMWYILFISARISVPLTTHFRLWPWPDRPIRMLAFDITNKIYLSNCTRLEARYNGRLIWQKSGTYEYCAIFIGIFLWIFYWY